MLLKDLLQSTSKAQLQAYYLYWFPGKEIVSAREKLAADLYEVMTDHVKARQRFESLTRAQQGFVVSLLTRHGYSGTVDEIRSQKHGRVIEGYEVENVLKSLQESGYILKTAGTGGYSSEVFSLPEELATALKRTISVEERQPLEMLSRAARTGSAGEATLPPVQVSGQGDPEKLGREAETLVDGIADGALRAAVRLALDEHLGVLTVSAAAQAGLLGPGDKSGTGSPDAGTGPAPGNGHLNRPEWRSELEAKGIGTTGVLCLKDYGLELEEEGLFVCQELVYGRNLARALEAPSSHEREISLGVDLVIDLDRALEVLRGEGLEMTREGTVYRKMEERIAPSFATAKYPEVFESSAVQQVLDLARKLQFFEEEDQRMVVDPLRRRVWRKKPLLRKVGQVYEVYRNESRGQRWSFHQAGLREIFIDHLRRIRPGQWLVARHFLTAVVSWYLLHLEESKVASDFQERCAGDFRNETLVVPLPRLWRDLSYWVVHRLALLGIVDIAHNAGSFHSLRLSRLGSRFFGLEFPEAGLPGSGPAEGRPAEGSASTPESFRAGAAGAASGPAANSAPRHAAPRVLVNPDFEILLYPDAPEEASLMVSLFADRMDSERVKRYRICRDSLKRGILSGLSRDEILGFLEANAHGSVPPNVLFSIREWTEGVEVIRRQKVTLFRAHTPSGADRLAQILEDAGIPYERLNETAIMVRGGKNERLVTSLEEHLQDSGLFLE
jgi:hypothetical protein